MTGVLLNVSRRLEKYNPTTTWIHSGYSRLSKQSAIR